MKAHKPAKFRQINTFTVLLLFGIYIGGQTLWTTRRLHKDHAIMQSDPEARLDDFAAAADWEISDQIHQQTHSSLGAASQTHSSDDVGSLRSMSDATAQQGVAGTDQPLLGDHITATAITSFDEQQEQDAIDRLLQEQQAAYENIDYSKVKLEDLIEEYNSEEGVALSDDMLHKLNMSDPYFKKCKILIVDPSASYANELGLPTCDIDKIWPWDENSDDPAQSDLPHWALPSSTSFWVSQAIRNGDHFTRHMRLADLMFVNMHCYTSWYYKHWLELNSTNPYGPANDISQYITRFFSDGLFQTPQYIRTRGRRLAIARPWLAAPPGAMLDSCAMLRNAFTLAGESGAFCQNDRDKASRGDALILPPVIMQPFDHNATAVGTERPTFLHFHSQCHTSSENSLAEEGETDTASTVRWTAIDTLRGLISSHKDDLVGDDVLMTCGEISGWHVQEEIMSWMKQSRFCLIIPGHTQSDGLLSEAMLSGCIPVILGPPFHTLPMVRDVNYTDFAVFFNLTSLPMTLEAAHGMEALPSGDLEPFISLDKVVQVASLKEAIEWLKSMPDTELEARKAALDGHRTMFYYPPFPGHRTSHLAKTIVHRMCESAQRQKIEFRLTFLKRRQQQLQNGDEVGEDNGTAIAKKKKSKRSKKQKKSQ